MRACVRVCVCVRGCTHECVFACCVYWTQSGADVNGHFLYIVCFAAGRFCFAMKEVHSAYLTKRSVRPHDDDDDDDDDK